MCTRNIGCFDKSNNNESKWSFVLMYGKGHVSPALDSAEVFFWGGKSLLPIIRELICTKSTSTLDGCSDNNRGLRLPEWACNPSGLDCFFVVNILFAGNRSHVLRTISSPNSNNTDYKFTPIYICMGW